MRAARTQSSIFLGYTRNTHTRTRTRTHIYHMYTQMCTHAHTYTRIHTCTHRCAHIHTFRRIHTCTHIHKCTHMHTYTHIHTHTHAHIYKCNTFVGGRCSFQMLWVEAPVARLCVCVFRGLLAVQIWTEEGRRGYLGKMTHEHIHQSSWLTSRNSGRDEKVKQTQISAGRYDGTLLGIRNREKSLKDGSRWTDRRWKYQLA